MWAVYLCGPTDCFLEALFMCQATALNWLKEQDIAPDRYLITRWEKLSDIDTSDTGWEQPK